MTQVLNYAYLDAAPAVQSATPARKTAGSRTLAGMLLAAVLSALLVVAGQVIDTWTDGHLLAGWVALWTVAFAALALLAPPLRKMSSVASPFDHGFGASGQRAPHGRKNVGIREPRPPHHGRTAARCDAQPQRSLSRRLIGTRSGARP